MLLNLVIGLAIVSNGLQVAISQTISVDATVGASPGAGNTTTSEFPRYVERALTFWNSTAASLVERGVAVQDQQEVSADLRVRTAHTLRARLETAIARASQHGYKVLENRTATSDTGRLGQENVDLLSVLGISVVLLQIVLLAYPLWSRSAVDFVMVANGFTNVFLYTQFIPDALAMSESFGFSEFHSGVGIGAYRLGCLLSNLGWWWFFRTEREEKLRRHLHQIFAFSASLSAAICISQGCLFSFQLTIPWRPHAVILLRFLLGTANVVYVTYVALTLLTSSDRARVFMTWNMTELVFAGMGFVTAAVDDTITDGIFPQHAALPFFSAVVLLLLLALVALFPSIESVALSGEEENQRTNGSANRFLLCCLITGAALASYAIGSLESATSYILETDYGWPATWSGLAIALSFFGGIPLYFFGAYIGNIITEAGVFRMFASLACFGSLFISDGACSVIRLVIPTSCEYVLLVGDAFFFVSARLVMGMFTAYMMNNAEPLSEKSFNLFDQSNLSLVDMLTYDLGPAVAAPMARWMVETVSKNGYAVMQLSITLSMWSLFEVLYFGYPEAFSESQKDEVVHPETATSHPYV